MSNGRNFDGAAVYEIKVAGTLGPEWSDWFEGFVTVSAVDGNTRLTGTVADQPALHGFLARIRDLGLPLLAVRRLSPPDG
ncbi:MAG: hypothetical protein JXC32_21300 [Anaerolineae bacterium]|nr:hypothetical protein [Anaerolineae bacterium]